MTNALAVVQPSFQEIQTMAAAVAKSGLFGAKTPEQALTLLLLAQAEGLHPMIAARDYDIIQNRPAKKSEAMLRSFQNSGGCVEWIELTDTVAKAKFIPPQGSPLTLDWTIDRATKAGLTAKDGSMYKKYPRQMLRARCISEGIKTVWPAATSGMLVPEEIRDEEIIPEGGAAQIEKVPGKAGRLKSMIQDKPEDVTEAEHRPAEDKGQPEKSKEEKVDKPKDKKEEKTEKKNPIAEMVEGVIEELKISGTRMGCRIKDKWYGTANQEIYKDMAAAADKKSKVRIMFTTRAGATEGKILNDVLDVLELPEDMPI